MVAPRFSRDTGRSSTEPWAQCRTRPQNRFFRAPKTVRFLTDARRHWPYWQQVRPATGGLHASNSPFRDKPRPGRAAGPARELQRKRRGAVGCQRGHLRHRVRQRANLNADTIGAITSIQTTGKGQFSQSAIDDLSDPGRNLLVFIHGFDNSFENAITRAAFNQQWFAGSGLQDAETSVVAFSWPSAGKLIRLAFPTSAYRRDQTVAGQSGLHIMTFFANLEPIIASARAKGNRVFLLAHSMGNWALQSAVENWFAHGNGDARCSTRCPRGGRRDPQQLRLPADWAPQRARPARPARLGLCQREGRVLEAQHGGELRRQAARPGRGARPLQHRALPGQVSYGRLRRLPDYTRRYRQLTPILPPLAAACAWTSPTPWPGTSDTSRLTDRQKSVS